MKTLFLIIMWFSWEISACLKMLFYFWIFNTFSDIFHRTKEENWYFLVFNKVRRQIREVDFILIYWFFQSQTEKYLYSNSSTFFRNTILRVVTATWDFFYSNRQNKHVTIPQGDIVYNNYLHHLQIGNLTIFNYNQTFQRVFWYQTNSC